MKKILPVLILLLLAVSNVYALSPGDEAYNKGMEYYEKGMWDEAIVEFDKAIQLNPNNAKFYNNRGLAYFFKGDYAKSTEDVLKVKTLEKKSDPDLKKSSGTKQ